MPIALVVVLVGLLGIGWYYSDQLLAPADAVPGYPDTSLGPTSENGVSSVVLAAAADTNYAGVWGLAWPGGSAQLGPVLSDKDGRVVRPLIGGTVPPAGTKVGITPFMWADSDPKSALGLDFSTVMVPTTLGPAPAWLTPGSGDTWVIGVHGHGSTRQETLRVIPTLHKLGMSVLSITYRNDQGAPRSSDGLYHLGDTEWQDVESAMRYATGHGAKHIVLYGWSMGGSIVEQVMSRSALANEVDAVVLDSPSVDWTRTLDIQGTDLGLPFTGALTQLAELVSNWRTGIDFQRLDLLDRPPTHRPTTLLFQGSIDTAVPPQAARDLAAEAKRLNWPLRYVEVPKAPHTASWNVDQSGYERDLSDFLKVVGQT